jgi:hypothetical protein
MKSRNLYLCINNMLSFWKRWESLETSNPPLCHQGQVRKVTKRRQLYRRIFRAGIKVTFWLIWGSNLHTNQGFSPKKISTMRGPLLIWGSNLAMSCVIVSLYHLWWNHDMFDTTKEMIILYEELTNCFLWDGKILVFLWELGFEEKCGPFLSNPSQTMGSIEELGSFSC